MTRFWRNIDLRRLSIPEDILLKKDSVNVSEGVKIINDAKLYFREAQPPSDTTPSVISILMLHGRMFSSNTWLELGTLHTLAAMGYRCIAVDLPGYGNTPAVQVPNKADFLQSIIVSFGLSNPVIVSPSMSGFFSLPHLLKYSQYLGGYIPVAPVGIEVLEELPTTKDLSCRNEVYLPLQQFLYDPVPDLSHLETPTMVVFGEKDRSRSSALLNLLPNSQSQEIPNGSHPAYLDNPNLWHQLLYNFLEHLSHSK